MKAICDFTATINGAEYALKKGEEFKGDRKAAAILVRDGMLSEGRETAKKEDSDVR